MGRKPNNQMEGGVFVLTTKKKRGEPQLGLLGLGLSQEKVARFMILYVKFKKSLEWILEHTEKMDQVTEERFFSTVVEPMDNCWEKLSHDTRQTLIRRKAV